MLAVYVTILRLAALYFVASLFCSYLLNPQCLNNNLTVMRTVRFRVLRDRYALRILAVLVLSTQQV